MQLHLYWLTLNPDLVRVVRLYGNYRSTKYESQLQNNSNQNSEEELNHDINESEEEKIPEIHSVGQIDESLSKVILNKFEIKFKMISPKLLSTSNMYLFNSKCQIQKYKSAIDIIKYFYEERLPCIEKRKENMLNELINDIDVKENKIRFIKIKTILFTK